MRTVDEAKAARRRIALLLVAIALLAFQLRSPLVALAPVAAEAQRGWGGQAGGVRPADDRAAALLRPLDAARARGSPGGSASRARSRSASAASSSRRCSARSTASASRSPPWCCSGWRSRSATCWCRRSSAGTCRRAAEVRRRASTPSRSTSARSSPRSSRCRSARCSAGGSRSRPGASAGVLAAVVWLVVLRRAPDGRGRGAADRAARRPRALPAGRARDRDRGDVHGAVRQLLRGHDLAADAARGRARLLGRRGGVGVLRVPARAASRARSSCRCCASGSGPAR